MTYKFFKGTSDTVQTDCIVRISDKALIPFDVGNIDYQEYLEWKAKGNKPEEAD